MATASSSGAVKSAMRTLDLLELLVRQARPMAANEIAAALSIPMSSLSYLLATLVDRGYLRRDGRSYSAGPAIERLRPAPSAPTIAELATPLVLGLRGQLNETAGFFVRRGFESEAVASAVSEQALRYTIDVGRRVPLHSVSAGKAMLATLSPQELDHYFASVERVAFTPRTLVTEAALRGEIEEIRRTGIAWAREEQTPGIIGLGRAVIADGASLGAFSVAIPAARFDAAVEERTIRLLKRAADALASNAAAARGVPGEADPQ